VDLLFRESADIASAAGLYDKEEELVPLSAETGTKPLTLDWLAHRNSDGIGAIVDDSSSSLLLLPHPSRIIVDLEERI
jgi:hypothetical protein